MRTVACASGSAELRFPFEDYVLDTERRELRRGTELVPLAPRVFDLLDYLTAIASASSARAI